MAAGCGAVQDAARSAVGDDNMANDTEANNTVASDTAAATVVETTTTAPTTTTTAPTTTTIPLDPTEQWQLDLAQSGLELPGGGTELFPDRRLVAFYGSPVTFRLGTLGERSAEANIERLVELAAEYQQPTVEGEPAIPVIPAFELIVTVATAKAGDDGDYSNEQPVDEVRPWVNAAAAAGVYVVLDLQPGRTDFLTQAKRYEELLRLPNVGLALDPEWRIGPDEVHLRRIGSVEAAEVNQVVDYLVELVHEEALPQKALVLHQFLPTMLPDRELIRTPPELAVIVHADGQGPLGTKYDTYDQLLGEPIGPDQTLWWGWKNFYDEDSPMATPAQVNQLDPLPVMVSYQ